MTRSLFILILVGMAHVASAENPTLIDDGALFRSFEAKIGELHRNDVGLSATKLRRLLRAEPRAEPRTEPKSATPFEAVTSRAPLARPKLYQNTKAATLLLGHLYLCDDCDKLHGSLASGVIVSPDGLVLTNFHVLDFPRARAFGAMTAEGQAFAIAEVIAASRKHDLALIRLTDATDLPFLSLADQVEIGETIHLVSHPDSHFFTFSTGIVSRFFRHPKTHVPRLQITAPFARGSSGSAVVNASGQLVGIASSTSSIYYEQDDEEQKNLQMVIHTCVPLEAIRALCE